MPTFAQKNCAQPEQEAQDQCTTYSCIKGGKARFKYNGHARQQLAQFYSTWPQISFTLMRPRSTWSSTHNVRVSRCLTLPTPLLVAMALAADESVDNSMPRTVPVKSANKPAIPRASHAPLTTPQYSASPLDNAMML